jgi:hypothetical protein
MKHWIFFLIIAVALPVWAQDKPAAEKPPAKEPEAMKETAKPSAERPKQAAAGSRKSRRWNEDARHCLERPTNTEVIKCAEEYL